MANAKKADSKAAKAQVPGQVAEDTAKAPADGKPTKPEDKAERKKKHWSVLRSCDIGTVRIVVGTIHIPAQQEKKRGVHDETPPSTAECPGAFQCLSPASSPTP